jgi:acylglycerol lipase
VGPSVEETLETDLEAKAADGTRLVGRLWRRASAPSSLLVLVHGLKDHGGRYGAVAEALNARGTAVAAFDLRGHARSGGERAWVRRFTEYASDLDAELSVVRERFGPVRTTLFGHSMGGAIAARYALDHPDRLDALVLSAPALRPPTNAPPGAAGIVRFLSAVAPHVRVFRPDIPGFSRLPDVVAAIEHDPLVDQRPVPARTAAELLRTMRELHRDAPSLRLPILAFYGTADRVTDPSGTIEFVGRTMSTDRHLRAVSDAYHDLWHEPESAILREELAEWVAKSSP